jgi:hypothetical protein
MINNRNIIYCGSSSSIYYCISGGCSFLNVYFVLSVNGLLAVDAAHKINNLI